MDERARQYLLDLVRNQPSIDKPETESEVAARVSELLARSAGDDGAPVRWRQLTETQRNWLASKSKEELEQFDAMAKDYAAAKLLGRAGKYLVVILMTVFGAAFAFAKFGLDVFKLVKGGGS